MGAKKTAAPIDFAEAERKAAEEAERIKQLGYDRQREQEEEERRQKEAAAAAATAKVASPVATNFSKTTTPVETKPRGSAQDMERLGMGMKRLGFGAVPVAASSSAPRCVYI